MLVLKDDYKPTLSMRDTQKAIKIVRDTFEDNLAARLNLERISAPLFVTRKSGINDDLNGVERAVSFDVKEMPEAGDVVIVHSLAKWKRLALKKYGFMSGEGFYTDMNAIRRDEDMDNLHSIYVDQWDWEKVINREDRNIDYLKNTVKSIINALVDTLELVKEKFPQVKTEFTRDVFFITTQELEDMYPDLTAKEREKAITKEKQIVFLMQIGGKLKSGKPHDGRAPDYDDWSLNGDILVYSDVLEDVIEISSMGIRVDENSLDNQLNIADKNERREFDYHKQILNGTLPLTIGGGIGQSRVCMLLLGKLHIGEVQASLWSDEMIKTCAEKNVNLL
ncbi:MAG: aspartate--ammonia ligase [Ruminococcaceae bacterium]|nr:aspartate--ammonia ligase [Oscillospiraceae bacterium]